MPKDLTLCRPPAKLGLNARESLQIRRHTKTDNLPDPPCICTARGILRAMRGTPTLPCSQMPWQCPLAALTLASGASGKAPGV